MPQKPDQHGQEEHYVYHENTDSVGEAFVSMNNDACIHHRIEHRFSLFDWCAHEYKVSKMESFVKLRTIVKSLQAQHK